MPVTFSSSPLTQVLPDPGKLAKATLWRAVPFKNLHVPLLVGLLCKCFVQSRNMANSSLLKYWVQRGSLQGLCISADDDKVMTDFCTVFAKSGEWFCKWICLSEDGIESLTSAVDPETLTKSLLGEPLIQCSVVATAGYIASVLPWCKPSSECVSVLLSTLTATASVLIDTASASGPCPIKHRAK